MTARSLWPLGSRFARAGRGFRLRLGGLVLLTAWIAAPVAAIDPPAELATIAQDGRRLLVIALDAVPFDVMARVTDHGRPDPLFGELSVPVPLISSFPSTTTLAFTGMFESLGLEIPPGYEAKFFDRARGKRRGGGLVSYHKIPFSWRDFFDWKVEGVARKGFGYARPRRFFRREVERGLRAFLDSDRPVFFLYVSSTDAIAHLQGPPAIAEMLPILDRALDKARSEQDFHTVLLSDHGVAGGRPLRNVRVPVRKALSAAGWRIGHRLARPNDIVLVPFGLLSSLIAFTGEGVEAEAAGLIAAVPGVSICVAPAGDQRWQLFGGGGSASLERRDAADGVAWRYLADGGDPLFGGELSGRWVADAEWLERTAAGRFPDGPHRIARAFDTVTNPASVVCSLEPGTMFGAPIADWSGRSTVGALRYTHGALERRDSLGFLSTDIPGWSRPAVLRFDSALRGIVELAPPREAHPAEDQ